MQIGDTVEAGDLIAVIPQTQLLERLEGVRLSGTPEEAEELSRQYQDASMIYSPVSGRVMELVECGDKVQPGEMLASITNSDIYSNEEEIRAYVSVTTAQSIKRGMKVRVYPQSSAGKQ